MTVMSTVLKGFAVMLTVALICVCAGYFGHIGQRWASKTMNSFESGNAKAWVDQRINSIKSIGKSKKEAVTAT